MKNTKRIICTILAMVMALSIMLTGCSRPQVTFNEIPQTAATYDGGELTSGQYLAFLYLEFENLYYNQGLYQYEMYGMDPWEQQFPYGETEEKLYLSDYIIRATQDNIKRQIVLQQIMKDNGIEWIAEDLADINESLAAMAKDAYIDLGFNNDSYAYALKHANLNERSAFYGLYGKGGNRAIAETELKEYFEKNYVSYKAITIALTDSNGKELDKEGEAYQKIMDRMNNYMEIYEKEGFDAAYEAYEKDQKDIEDIKKTEATKTTTTTGTSGTGTTGTGTDASAADTTAATTTTTTATTTTTSAAEITTGTDASTTTGTAAEKEEEEHEHEHEHRQDVDSTTMDEALKDVIMGKTKEDGTVEIEAIEVGDCKIVEYKAGGSTPTAALIERLDINKDDEGKEGAVYDEAVENIIYTKKYDEFNEEVLAAMAKLKITFNEKVVEKCLPKTFLDIINNL